MKKKTLLTIIIGAGLGIAISAGVIALEVHKRKKEAEETEKEAETIGSSRGHRAEVVHHENCRCCIYPETEERVFGVDLSLKPIHQTEELENEKPWADPMSFLKENEEAADVQSTEEDEESPKPNDEAEEDYVSPISIISVDEFYCSESDEENSKYEKISLDYFSLDDTLSDEQGEAILTPEKVIGEALSCFGEKSKDPDIVYVRNEDVTTDFEIVRHNKSYSEYVLGYSYPEDEERKHPKEKDD